MILAIFITHAQGFNGLNDKLLDIVKSLPCRVAISGYESELYLEQLSEWSTITNEHYVCVRKSIDGKKPKVRENLWINYDKHTKHKII